MNYLLRKGIALPLLTVMLVFAFVVWMGLSAVASLLRSRDQIEQTHEFLRSLVTLLATATDAETGQRGFILTGDDAYLEPYLAAHKNVDQELERARVFADTASHHEIAIGHLAMLVAQRETVLDQQVALRRQEGLAAAVEALRTGRAKAEMDEIRREVAKLTEAGNALLAHDRAEARRALRHAILAGAGGVGACVLLFVLVFVRIGREMGRRRAAEDALRVSHEDLEIRVAARTAELRDAEEQARIAWQKAEDASQAKSNFLSRVSHELRTPLNAILGFGQLMEMGQRLPHEQGSNLQHIMRGGRHLLDLVDELLDLTAVESGRLPISVEPVLLYDAIVEAAGMMIPQARDAGVRINLVHSPLSEAYVTADRQRLKQVLINLLSNAVKFNHREGFVEVTCELAGEDRLRVDIEDTGRGIAPDDVEKLFAPFQRVGAFAATHEGSGLGLSLSKGLITAMGGTMGVRSEVGKGSHFWFELGRAEIPSSSSSAVAVPFVSSRIPNQLGSKTILYIEDNLANLKLLEHILQSRPGWKLLSSMQGSIGLELALSRLPDLILLDLQLPDIDGREVLRRLRFEPATRNTPVFILSADATPHHRERLLSSGAQAYLSKPIDVREFLALLDRTLAGESVDDPVG